MIDKLTDHQKDILVKQVKNSTQAIGKQSLLNHYNDMPLTHREAVAAKCYQCQGYYKLGKLDCEVPSCPIYSFMPYRGRSIC